MTTAELMYQQLFTLFAQGDGQGGDNHNQFLLIDQSAYPRLPELKSTLELFEYISFLTLDEPELDGASPLLLSIGDARDERSLNRLLFWLCEQGLHANALQWLQSPEDLHKLALRLMLRTQAITPEKTNVVLRYFDTRILPVLFKVFSAQQLRLLLSCTSAWWYADRYGVFQRAPATTYEPGATTDRHLPFELTSEQELGLIAAGDVDAVVALLLDKEIASVTTMTPPQQYDYAAPLIARANAYGIHDLPAVAAFCSLGFDIAADFFEHSPWAERLEDVRAGRRSFEEVLNDA